MDHNICKDKEYILNYNNITYTSNPWYKRPQYQIFTYDINNPYGMGVRESLLQRILRSLIRRREFINEL